MPEVAVEVAGRLDAEPARVWSRLIDRDGVAEWMDDVDSLAGDGEDAVARLSGDETGGWIDVRVTDLEPRRHLRLRLDRPSSLLKEARVEVDLEPDDEGTAYRLGVRARPRMLARPLMPLVRLRAEVALHRAVRGFKAAMDADRRGERPLSSSVSA